MTFTKVGMSRDIRLHGCDLHQLGSYAGYMQLLAQLTLVGNVTEVEFKARFHELSTNPDYQVLVAEADIGSGALVGTATLLLERKFLRHCGKLSCHGVVLPCGQWASQLTVGPVEGMLPPGGATDLANAMGVDTTATAIITAATTTTTTNNNIDNTNNNINNATTATTVTTIARPPPSPSPGTCCWWLALQVGHIEDVVVDERCRGARLGLRLITALTEAAQAAGCYKVVLDCSEDNVAFYEKCGLRRKDVQMANYFDMPAKTVDAAEHDNERSVGEI
ncbi:hypothetical protein QJQ45_007325 [Haematococcus lacustris]|nr:hypothetical protein QJQ45_007325 [Haematococcus lacustris]